MRLVILTVLFGIACLLIDSLIPEVATTPLLGLCWLLGVSMLKNWKEVAVSCILLIPFVITSQIHQSPGKTFVRSGSFLVASGMAIALSWWRHRTLDALSSAEAIVKGAPIPMVAADITGAIVAASDEAIKLVDPTLKVIIGQAFPDIFMGHLPPGNAFQLYFDWFQSQDIHTEKIRLRDCGSPVIYARILATGSGTDRLLVATFQSQTAHT